MRVEARRVATSRARGGAAAPAVQAACRPPPTEEGRAGSAGRHQRICRSRLSSALGTYAVPTDRDLKTLGLPSRPHPTTPSLRCPTYTLSLAAATAGALQLTDAQRRPSASDVAVAEHHGRLFLLPFRNCPFRPQRQRSTPPAFPPLTVLRAETSHLLPPPSSLPRMANRGLVPSRTR